MTRALELAREAATRGEVPVGAVVVFEGTIIAEGSNRREELHSALSHAEIHAIEKACQVRGAWRLSGCQLFVTLEPCIMCAGAIHQARIDRVIFGAYDPKAGALGSLYKIHEDARLNHRYVVEGGLMESTSQALLKEFFRSRR